MIRPPRIAAVLAWLVATLIASTALAATTLPGVNLRWDDCLADGGVMNKTFTCDTNAGTSLAVMSLQLDTAMPVVSGLEIRISLKAAAPTLPAWWQFKNAGGCRVNGLCFVASPAVSLGRCADWGHGLEMGGLGAYRDDELGPGSAVILIASAVAGPRDLTSLDANTEYVLGALRITHAGTAGAGACGGCQTPVCLLFTSVNVTTPVLADNRLFTQGANGADSAVIHWQNGQLANLSNSCTGTFNCNTQFECTLAAEAAPTAARRSTWGAVKSLYK